MTPWPAVAVVGALLCRSRVLARPAMRSCPFLDLYPLLRRLAAPVHRSFSEVPQVSGRSPRFDTVVCGEVYFAGLRASDRGRSRLLLVPNGVLSPRTGFANLVFYEYSVATSETRVGYGNVVLGLLLLPSVALSDRCGFTFDGFDEQQLPYF